MYLFVHICCIYILINNRVNNSLRFICFCMCYFKPFCSLSAEVRVHESCKTYFCLYSFKMPSLIRYLISACLIYACLFISRLHAGGLFGYAVSFHAQRWWAYICAFITTIWHTLREKNDILKTKSGLWRSTEAPAHAMQRCKWSLTKVIC